MKTTIQLYGKAVSVELTDVAERMLAQRATPIFAEVQLIFGCMVAKRVWFRDAPNAAAVAVSPKLYVWFRPARYEKACSFDDIDNGAEVSDYPMKANRKNFVPDALSIDYRAGKWLGDFTYSMNIFRAQNTAIESPS